MKNFKKIEKKDPYEYLVSTKEISARDLVDIKKLIIFSRCSFIGFIISLFLFKSLFYKILIQSVIENVFLEFLIIFVICWILVVIFILSLPCIYEIIKLIYNFIVNRVIGVDSYYEIAMLLEFIFEKTRKPIDREFDYYYDEFEKNEDQCYEADEADDNSQDSNVIYVDFSNKTEP